MKLNNRQLCFFESPKAYHFTFQFQRANLSLFPRALAEPIAITAHAALDSGQPAGSTALRLYLLRVSRFTRAFFFFLFLQVSCNSFTHNFHPEAGRVQQRVYIFNHFHLSLFHRHTHTHTQRQCTNTRGPFSRHSNAIFHFQFSTLQTLYYLGFSTVILSRGLCKLSEYRI